MAFSFANVAAENGGNGDPQQSSVQVQDGEELREVSTGQLGFMTVNGEVKIKLLPSPWPGSDLPVPSAQLLSVASSQGLLAAAGPDRLVIVSTDEVRKVLGEKEGGNLRDIKPLLSIPQERLSQVAFSSDESVLVVSPQATGGLFAYQVDKLKAGDDQPALQISTQNLGLRSLIPNPSPQSAFLFAAIDTNGDLLMADLSQGRLVTGSDGIVLKKGVSCVSWSNRGKQLVAGLIDGTAAQLKPDGTSVAHIPKSTSISEGTHVSSIAWLEDDTFFAIYTPHETSAAGEIPASDYFIIERKNKTNFTFSKLPEILPPFGLERLPTHHFVSRLRRFDPHITDMLLLSATTASEVGIVSKTSEPLNSQEPVVDHFTLTSIDDDSKRATLPLSSGSSLDTSPVGMTIDLSSKEPVINPLPSNPEIQQSAGPVPNLLLLNNEGVLCSWWIIYNDSIEAKSTYSGFETLRRRHETKFAASPSTGNVASPAASEPTSASTPAATSTARPFAAPSPLTDSPSKPSPFGGSTVQWGSGTSDPQAKPPAFGTASTIGDTKPSWTSTGFGSTTPDSGSTFGKSGFGQPAFGAPSAMSGNATPAFGASSAFGKPAAFGQTGFGSKPTTASFGTASKTNGNTGFASFANTGGFGGASNKSDETKQSPFAKPAATGAFGQASAIASPFAKASSGAAFAQATRSESPFAKASGTGAFGQPPASSPFGKSQGFGGFGSSTTEASRTGFGNGAPFKIDSSFKGDGTAKTDLPAPTNGGSFGFGSGFNSLLGETKNGLSPTHNTEAEMDDDQEDQGSVSSEEKERPFAGFSPDEKKSKEETHKNLTTPPSTIAQPKTTPAPPLSNLFGVPQQKATSTPQQAFGGTFSFASTTPKETPAAARTLFGTNPVTQPTPAAVATSEPKGAFSAVPEVQTPEPKTRTDGEGEEGTPKITTESPSDDGIVSVKKHTDPPLPPDPLSKPGYTTGDTSASSANSKEPDDAPLPPDFLPANKSALVEEAEHATLPTDEDDGEDEGFSSDFDDSGEDVTQDISPVEEAEEDQEDDQEEDTTVENVDTSPESSFKGGDTTSPTGGLFTKVSTIDTSRTARPLFGEINAPIFPPPAPKLQQSPRSPSPVRRLVPHDSLRPDSRSVSAPVRPKSAIEQRKTEYSQSAIAAQAAKAREEEAAREKARLDALELVKQRREANELQSLEDDEDERLQSELAAPVQPSKNLDDFITYQSAAAIVANKADIPAQIERLYQDINSMVYTLGINARSLSSFLLYQDEQPRGSDWPSVLQSDTPLDALNSQWFLADINRLREGYLALEDGIEQVQVPGFPQKLENCQVLLARDLFDLRTKITAIRKSLHARAHGSGATAPLSAEQASVQHDLRRAAASVQTKLAQAEDALAVMRARLAEVVPSDPIRKRQSLSNSQTFQKKPTVEAITNTVMKMTSMAEKKSADIDVLEAQLRKFVASGGPTDGDGQIPAEIRTPHRFGRSRNNGSPGSATSSVFYTPDSTFGGSARSTRSRTSNALSLSMVSAEDKARWQARATKKKEVAAVLRSVLESKRRPAGPVV